MAKETIAGLAKRLGISKASVSYALNGQPGVSEVTRRRVLDLAEELDHPYSTAFTLHHAGLLDLWRDDRDALAAVASASVDEAVARDGSRTRA